jgi:hypothetical protein
MNKWSRSDPRKRFDRHNTIKGGKKTTGKPQIPIIEQVVFSLTRLLDFQRKESAVPGLRICMRDQPLMNHIKPLL